jgi:CrcB protein
MRLGCLFVAGGLGALARFALGGWAQRLYGGEFPWGTFVVNVVGCFFFGFIWTLADERLIISGETRLIVLTGFMGAFTTFSTFAFESGMLMRDAQWWPALGNVALHVVLGILAVLLGGALGRLL